MAKKDYRALREKLSGRSDDESGGRGAAGKKGKRGRGGSSAIAALRARRRTRGKPAQPSPSPSPSDSSPATEYVDSGRVANEQGAEVSPPAVSSREDRPVVEEIRLQETRHGRPRVLDVLEEASGDPHFGEIDRSEFLVRDESESALAEPLLPLGSGEPDSQPPTRIVRSPDDVVSSESPDPFAVPVSVPPYGTAALAADVAEALRTSSKPRTAVARIAIHLQRYLSDPRPLSERFRTSPSGDGPGVHEIHRDDETGFAIVVRVWSAGQFGEVYDEGAWGVEGVVAGPVQLTRYLRVDNRSIAGKSKLVESGNATVPVGGVWWILPPHQSIRRIGNPSDGVAVTIHAIGPAVGERTEYDPAAGTCRTV